MMKKKPAKKAAPAAKKVAPAKKAAPAKKVKKYQVGGLVAVDAAGNPVQQIRARALPASSVENQQKQLKRDFQEFQSMRNRMSPQQVQQAMKEFENRSVGIERAAMLARQQTPPTVPTVRSGQTQPALRALSASQAGGLTTSGVRQPDAERQVLPAGGLTTSGFRQPGAERQVLSSIPPPPSNVMVKPPNPNVGVGMTPVKQKVTGIDALKAQRQDRQQRKSQNLASVGMAPTPPATGGMNPPPGMAKGGMAKKKAADKKVSTVMKEFKAGKLHSGKGGKVVKNPKQAIAIALSEAGKAKAKPKAKPAAPKKKK